MPPPAPLDADRCAIILSGGLARRAGGVNKSFLLIHGRPIIKLQLEILRPLFGERIAVVTDRPSDFHPYSIETYSDIPISDARALERSSLRGLASALAAAPSPIIFLLAADMPYPDSELIRLQSDYLAHPPPSGLLLRRPSGIEPFHGFYNKALAPSAARRLESGDSLSLRGWIADEPGLLLATSADLGVDPSRVDRCLANINQP